MSLPDFIRPPDAPIPPADVETYPRVLTQSRQGDDTMLVTFALPGLRRHTVTVPLSSWLRGEHLRIGAHAHKTLDAFLPTFQPDDIEPPSDTVEHDG